MFFERRLIEFCAKVSSHRDEGMKDGVVANHPWRETGQNEDAGESAAKERWKDGAPGFECAQEHPEAADREEQEQSGVEQRDESGENPEGGPACCGLGLTGFRNGR